MSYTRRIFLAACIMICPTIWTARPGFSKPQAKPQTNPGAKNSGQIGELVVPRAAISPLVDGALDDQAWQGPPLPTGEWLTYNPLYGSKMVQQTQVRAAYDQKALYFAFHCLDPQPDKIQSAISRRDTIFNDDWVGVSLDSLGSHQSSYEFFVNPDGVQGDILNSSTAGEDTSPDWVWQSAARKTGDGYTVEIQIPFKSIRFTSGAVVKMEVLFWRRVSRLGISASWPNLSPGTSIFTRHAPLILHEVERPLTLELIPNLTYALNQTRSAPDSWDSDSKTDAGITAKYGISSTVTLDGTFRPDYSQVESDAFQVEVNQRYPIFFSEKRPFFMEGMGTFELAGVGGDANMRTAVHTRRIIDPLFGLKLTGTVGKVTFAALSSSDQAPGNTELSDPLYEKEKYFNIARAFYSLGKGTYIGGLVTDTELDEGYNKVVAGDLSLQFGEHQQVTATALATRSRDSDGGNGREGMAGQAAYSYNSKRHTFITQFEHYDKDFNMETAFYNRTGMTTNWTYYSPSFYPDEKRYPWFKKFAPFIYAHTGRDRIQGGDEYFLLGGIRMNFTRQGYFRVDYADGREPWAGNMFDIRQFRVMGEAQFFPWLHLFGYFTAGRSIYYDLRNPFQGDSRNLQLDVSLQPTSKLNQGLTYNRVLFNRSSNGERVYTVDVINSKTTYQFNRNFFVRAIHRYDSSRKNVLLDYLASYEPVPGTVAYAGYGSLLGKQEWDGTVYVPGQGDYTATHRSFFFKLSYLYRF